MVSQISLRLDGRGLLQSFSGRMSRLLSKSVDHPIYVKPSITDYLSATRAQQACTVDGFAADAASISLQHHSWLPTFIIGIDLLTIDSDLNY